jgi:general secretion pathway protein D
LRTSHLSTTLFFNLLLPAVLLGVLLTACQSEDSAREPRTETLQRTAPEEVQPPPAAAQAQERAPQPAPPPLAEPILIKGTVPAIKVEDTSPPLPSDIADITINMVDAEIGAVIKAALGDALGLPYSLDSDVQGTLTLRTNRPVTQAELISNLEAALFGAGYALLYQDGKFRVATLERARQSVVLVEGDVPGFGTQAIQLKHVMPGSIAEILTQYARQGAELSTDDAHRLVLVTGPQPIRQAIADLATDFDTDSFSGKSFGVFPLSATDPATLIDELSAIFGKADPGSARAELQFVPLERMNAILVIAARAELVDQVQQWIGRLDRSDRSQEKRLFVHYVEHGEATKIASVLQQLFGSVSDSPVIVIPGATAPGLDTVIANAPAQAPQPVDIYNDITQQPAIQSQVPYQQQPPEPQPLDQPPLQAQPAVAPPLSGPGGGISAAHGEIRIIADDQNNAIFVLASERDYKLVQTAIEHLDIGLLQVLIEATIAEVSLTDNLRYGVQWFFEHNNSSITLSRVASGATNALFPGFGYLLAADNATVVIDALEAVTDVNVISAPQVMVLDNRVARLEVGDEVPIATQSAVSTIDPDAPIVNSISYRNTGVILTVQPRVNSSGFVTLTIEQEVSDVVPTTTSGIDSPTFRNRRIKSSVTVKDGATIALGGLIRDGRTEGTQGIPVLSRIPVLGTLFGQTTDNAQRTELLVLLTPRVVRNPEEADSVTHELKQRLQSLWMLSKDYQPEPH